MSFVFTRIVKPAYLKMRYVRSRIADRQLGIITTDELVAPRIEQDETDAHPFPGGVHRAIPFAAVHRLIRHLRPSQEDVLLDYGCGAGRVLCVAAQYPFARIIGVEINERVHALASQNAQALRHAIVRPEVVRADATTYRVPDDVTIAFLYNPFGGSILEAALRQLIASHDRRPRHLRLVYANPKEHDLVMRMGRFRETGHLWMSWRPGANWARTQMIRLYETVAP